MLIGDSGCLGLYVNFDEIKNDDGGDVILSLDVGDLEYESDEPACLQD